MSDIEEVAKTISEKFDVEKVILFGSYAYGKPNRSSDVDLLVVLKSSTRTRQDSLKLQKAFPDRKFPIDFVVRTANEIQGRIPRGDWFLRDIIQKGKLLYG